MGAMEAPACRAGGQYNHLGLVPGSNWLCKVALGLALAPSLSLAAPLCIPIPTPNPTLGGLVVFDFRLMHRGLPNDTPHARPVAYAVVGRGGARDEV